MPQRSPSRFLAPGALVAVVVAVVLVVSSGTGDSGSSPSGSTTTEAASTKKPKRKTYTVRANDNLSSIADRYGVTVDTLVELNPKIDPQALRAGQRLRLR